MFFSNKPTQVLYLARQTFDFYGSNNQVKSLQVPTEVFNNLEIQDEGQFDAMVKNFLLATNLKNQRVVIILSDEVIFQKVLRETSGEIEQQEAQRFFNEIPFDPEKVAQKQLRIQNQLFLIAANCQLYESLAKILKEIGWETVSIVPITLFTINNLQNLDFQSVTSILENKDLVRPLNFLIN